MKTTGYMISLLAFICAAGLAGCKNFSKNKSAAPSPEAETKAEGAPAIPYECDTFTTTSGKTVRIYALVHASSMIDYDGMTIYVDPVAKLGDRTVDYSALRMADIIFITHEHADHFDKETIASLTPSSTILITNSNCSQMLGKGIAMANGETLSYYGDSVEAVPAYNTTKGREKYHPKGRDNGYIITLDGLRIYFAGDTEDIPEMAKIKDIDIAFLPCNQPYTMTPEQLVKAAKVLSPKVLFPYHYGQTDVSGIQAALPDIDVRIRQYQ